MHYLQLIVNLDPLCHRFRFPQSHFNTHNAIMLSIVPKSAIPDLTEYIYDVIQHQIFFIDVHSKMFPWSGSPTAYVAEPMLRIDPDWFFWSGVYNKEPGTGRSCSDKPNQRNSFFCDRSPNINWAEIRISIRGFEFAESNIKTCFPQMMPTGARNGPIPRKQRLDQTGHRTKKQS